MRRFILAACGSLCAGSLVLSCSDGNPGSGNAAGAASGSAGGGAIAGSSGSGVSGASTGGASMGGSGASLGGSSASGTGGAASGGASSAGAAGGGVAGSASGGAAGASLGGAAGTPNGGAASGGATNGGAAGSVTAGAGGQCPSGGAASTTLPALTVQLSNQYRTVTHAASGSLYGLASDTKPTDSLIGPTKPFLFTQMAPNGQQLPNGATAPTGDSLKVAPAAARNGAKVAIRMPDIYPNFPYIWVSWADWYAKIDAMVTATLAANAPNIYAYEIWNEPNWTWDTADAGSFNEGWKNSYQRIKAKDSSTKIMGPSISIWDQGFMQSFLSYCKTNNCLPDIVSWHELGDANGVARPRYIPTSVAAYRALETSLGISKRAISIDEYGVVAEEGVPGDMIRYIAQFERQGVESACIAFWHGAGQLSDLITSGGKANGGWWLYKFYGDMSGTMAMTVPPTSVASALDLDGIASVDPTAHDVQVVFGGGTGDHAVIVQGFGSAPFFSCSAHVKAESTPWNGVNTAVSASTTLFESDYPISNGQVIVTIPGMVATSGYRLTITPS